MLVALAAFGLLPGLVLASYVALWFGLVVHRIIR
jgi:hypothetical protein